MSKSIFHPMMMALLVSLIVFPALAQNKVADPVLVTVDKKKIYLSDLANFQATLSPQIINQLAPQALLEQLVNNIVIAKQAKREKMDRKPDVKRAFEDAQMRILSKKWVMVTLEKFMTADVLQARYKKLKSEFKAVEEIHARHILVKTEDEAEDIIDDLDDGKDFATLAREKSIDPSAKGNSGDLGYFSRGKMIPVFEKSAFKIKPKTTLDEPVKSDFGWHVIRVEDKRMSKFPEFKAAEAQLRAILSEEIIAKMVAKMVKDSSVTYTDELAKIVKKATAPAAKK